MPFAAHIASFSYGAQPSITSVASRPAMPKDFWVVRSDYPQANTAVAQSESTTSVAISGVINAAWTDVDRSISKLLKLSQLGTNWDGYNASAANKVSLDSARKFLRSLSEKSIVPEPTLHADGSAILFYKTNDAYAEIEFLENDRIEFFASRGDLEWGGEFYLDGGELPAGLREIGIST